MALYSGGVMVASTSQALTSCSKMRLARASFLKAGGSRSARMSAMAAPISVSISFIHSSLVWCWMMNSISSCAGESGCWAESTWSMCR